MNSTPEQRRAENDRRIAANIAEFGCHVVSVFSPDEKDPSYSYSIGIQATSGAPEAIVFGVEPDLGHFMINEYNRQIQEGAKFQRGVRYAGFLEGFNIYVEPAEPGAVSEYTLGCTRYYKGTTYFVVQLIYPSTSGVWPWHKAAPKWFKSSQPLLGRKHPGA